MRDVDAILKLNDRNELLFYLDYTEQLIEMYIKRNIDPCLLKGEYNLIEQRIKEISE